MQKYIQFLKLSTGYIPDSIPPRFSDEYKKPIEALGSDGIAPIDGRWNSASAHAYAISEAKRRGAIGYRLCHGLTCNGWIAQSRDFLIGGKP